MNAPATFTPDAGHWRFERQAVVSPRQMGLMFLAFVLLLQAIGMGFALAGAEPIWGFAWLELMVVGVVLWRYARRAQDAETITLADSRLIVEVREGADTRRQEFQRGWAQVHLDHAIAPLVRIHQGRKDIHVGRFVPMAQRPALVRALRDWIRGDAHV